MVDCGFGLKETVKRLAELGICPEQLDAILVTHEHQDHISGVEALAARFELQVYMSEGTLDAWKSRGGVVPQIIGSDIGFHVNDVEILPVAVPHDAREPVQYVLSCGQKKVGILTDLGSLTRHIYVAYRDCQTLLIEANHDLQMLQQGAYPASLKKRIAGDWGHLNNSQAADLLAQLFSQGSLKQAIIGHVSEKNNRVDLVAAELAARAIPVEKITLARQAEPLGWMNL